MALVGNRRKHRLTVELPLPPPTGTTRLHFTPAIPTTTTTTSASSVSDYEKLSVLGHGNGGTVYKVRHRQNPSTTFALKLLHPSTQSDPALRRQVTREITVYGRASDSPHVLRCHSVLADHHSPALLLEYMDTGTLESLLRRHNTIPSTALPSISRQVLLGLSHLHSHQIVHRDIKPSNLLVNSHGEIKISDFGVSRVMARSLEHCHSFVGTCAYMSPERFDPDTYGHNYDGYAADVWSLGLTVMELFLGYFPLLPEGQRPDWATLMCAICFGDPPALPRTAPEELRSFVECCLQKEPSKRWTVAELLKHPFVTTEVEVSKEALLGLLVAPEEEERSLVMEL